MKQHNQQKTETCLIRKLKSRIQDCRISWILHNIPDKCLPCVTATTV